MSEIDEARRLFIEAGLAFPAIPEALAARLVQLDTRLFSTRDIEISPYFLDHYVREVMETDVEDYLVLAHSGHGVNSYAVQYYVVHGPTRLLLHLGWGGAYMDTAAATTRVLDCFSRADEIISLADTTSRLHASDRLIVVGSDFYGSLWRLPDGTGGRVDAGGNGPAEALSRVADWLTETDTVHRPTDHLA